MLMLSLYWPVDCTPAEKHLGESWRLRFTQFTKSDNTRAVVDAEADTVESEEEDVW